MPSVKAALKGDAHAKRFSLSRSNLFQEGSISSSRRSIIAVRVSLDTHGYVSGVSSSVPN
jgi:hypothetical protein